MSKDDGAKIIHRGTPEMEAFVANTKRAMALTPVFNRLTFDDADEVRALFSELTGSVVAAGSVVTKDVPPNTLVGGNPARVIRSIAD